MANQCQVVIYEIIVTLNRFKCVCECAYMGKHVIIIRESISKNTDITIIRGNEVEKELEGDKRGGGGDDVNSIHV